MSCWPHFRTARRGFSLIEVLVAIAATSIIMAALMQSLAQASRSWTSQTKSFSSLREARSAMQVLARDLACAAAPPPGLELPTTADYFNLDGSKDGFLSSKLAFLRVVPAQRPNHAQPRNLGELELVLYAVGLRKEPKVTNAASDNAKQQLLRKVFTPMETWEKIEKMMVEGLPLLSDTEWIDMLTATQGVEVLADNVIRFHAGCWKQTPTGAKEVVPEPKWKGQELPAALEVALCVTNTETATFLSSEADWQGRGRRGDDLTNGTPNIAWDDRETQTLRQRMVVNHRPAATP